MTSLNQAYCQVLQTKRIPRKLKKRIRGFERRQAGFKEMIVKYWRSLGCEVRG